MNRRKIYSRITDTILQKLREGTVPWKKSWKIGLPANFISKRTYNGINFLSLINNEYPSPYYLTFLQCSQKGGKINKGEKGYPIIFWTIKEINVSLGEEAEYKRVSIARLSYVFNLTQTDLHRDFSEVLKKPSCDAIIKNMKGEKPVIKHNHRRSYYSIKEDLISLPSIIEFNSPDEYYSTLFHELIHWTGSERRLNRFSTGRKIEAYSHEELIAEIGSAYLCGLTGIASKVIDNQAAYVDSWYSKINSNPDMLIDAAVQAQKSVEYIVNEQKLLCVKSVKNATV